MLKNITLSAEEELIQKAREKAHKEHTTLNASFRQWLKQFTNSSLKSNDYEQFIKSLEYVLPGQKFSREEMNER